MNSLFRSIPCCVLGVVSLAMAGCGGVSDAPKLGPVKGVVTYKQKPLASAQVLFTPKSGPMAMGETDEEGRFSLVTGGKTGAMLGPHQVTISAYEPFKAPAAGKEEEAQSAVSRIPQKYGDLRRSGLTADVKATGLNEFTFELQ